MKRGDVVYIADAGVAALLGIMAVVRRHSQRTGGLTIELLADAGAYKKGDMLHVPPYACRMAIEARNVPDMPGPVLPHACGLNSALCRTPNLCNALGCQRLKCRPTADTGRNKFDDKPN